ncbi:MAG TPA: undecaprenyl-diphosphatase [Desulfobulbus sp.]|nr:undecaprenyl-diphosphatase [Desulfobulbus sp.]
MNVSFFTWLHEGAGNQPVVDFFSVMAAELTPYLVIACMAIYWFTTDHKGKRVLLEGAAVVALGLLVNQLIAVFYFHPRPYMMGLCTPLIPHGPETSFPSDHATLLFGAAFALLFRSGWQGKGALLLGIAVLGAWGRVYTGLHFPFDMLGSFGVALFAVFILSSIRRALIPLYDKIIRIVNRIEALITRKESLSS